MYTPETPRKTEQPTTPEEYIVRDIADVLKKVRETQQRVARGDVLTSELDTLRDLAHRILDEGIHTMEHFGTRDEFGDMDGDRFKRPQ